MSIIEALNKLVGRENDAEKLYKELNTETYRERPFETENLHDDMAIVNEAIGEYWKPRFLMDHRAKCAYEFMSRYERLVTVTLDDIDWESLKAIREEDAISVAEQLSFHYPSFVLNYKNDVAAVRWQLNPDGMYYMDEDGYGMTDDREVDIYGIIDRKGKVLVKFKYIEHDAELDAMRAEAEQMVKG